MMNLRRGLQGTQMPPSYGAMAPLRLQPPSLESPTGQLDMGPTPQMQMSGQQPAGLASTQYVPPQRPEQQGKGMPSGADPMGDMAAINRSIRGISPGPGASRIAHGRGLSGASSYI